MTECEVCGAETRYRQKPRAPRASQLQRHRKVGPLCCDRCAAVIWALREFGAMDVDDDGEAVNTVSDVWRIIPEWGGSTPPDPRPGSMIRVVAMDVDNDGKVTLHLAGADD